MSLKGIVQAFVLFKRVSNFNFFINDCVQDLIKREVLNYIAWLCKFNQFSFTHLQVLKSLIHFQEKPEIMISINEHACLVRGEKKSPQPHILYVLG